MWWSVISWMWTVVSNTAIGIGMFVGICLLISTYYSIGVAWIQKRISIGQKEWYNNQSIYELRLSELITRILFFPSVWNDENWKERQSMQEEREYHQFAKLLWPLFVIPRVLYGILKMPYALTVWKKQILQNKSLRAIQTLLKIEKRIAKKERNLENLKDRIYTQTTCLKTTLEKKSEPEKQQIDKMIHALSRYENEVLRPISYKIHELEGLLRSEKKTLIENYRNTAYLLPEEIPEEMDSYASSRVEKYQQKYLEIVDNLKNIQSFRTFKPKENDSSESENAKPFTVTQKQETAYGMYDKA